MTPEEEIAQLSKESKELETKLATPAVTTAPTPEPGPTSHAKSFWEIAEADDAPLETQSKLTTEIRTELAPAKVSNEAAEAGARAAVGALNVTVTMLCRPLINWRFKKEAQKRFGTNLATAEELVVTDATPEDETEAKLKRKYEAFLAKRDEKITGLRFSDDEENDLTFAFKDYFKTTGKTMSPETMLVIAITGVVGTRVIDVVTVD